MRYNEQHLLLESGKATLPQRSSKLMRIAWPTLRRKYPLECKNFNLTVRNICFR